MQAFAGPGTTGADDASRHRRVRRSSCRTSGGSRRDADVNAGLRYDLQKIAQPPVRNPDAQLAAAGIDTSRLDDRHQQLGPAPRPRLDAERRSRYVVRGGYGLFYGRTPSIMVGTAHSNNGINVQTITFTGDAGADLSRTSSPRIPTGATLPKPTIFVFDQDYQNPQVQQAQPRRRVRS